MMVTDGGAGAPGLDLDPLDERLIEALEADGRASYAALGDATGISRSNARQRVKRLIDGGIVAVHGRVDPAALGIGVFTFAFVSVQGPARTVADELATHSEAVFVAETAGAHDILVELHCRDLGHLGRTLDVLRGVDGVGAVATASVVGYAKQRWSLDDRSATHHRTDEPKPHLDEIDERLADELQRDGRASFASLARIAGLSISSTRERVLRLVDTGTIEIHVIPGVSAIETHQFVGFFLNVAGPLDGAMRAAAAIPETTVVAALTGAHPVGIEAWCSDSHHLADITEQLRAIPGVTGLETLLYLHGNRFFDRLGRR